MKKVSKDDISHLMDYSIYPPTRTIYMGSEHVSDETDEESGTDTRMAERMVKALHILDNQTNELPITIIMNNIGGDEYHGMAIFDAIKGCKSHTIIKVYGHAMSMGAVILQAANERVMTPNSRLMVHYGTWGIHDHPKISYSWTDEGKRFDTLMEGIFMEKILEQNPGFKLKDLKKMLDFDTFLNAEESLALGLIDRIDF